MAWLLAAAPVLLLSRRYFAPASRAQRFSSWYQVQSCLARTRERERLGRILVGFYLYECSLDAQSCTRSLHGGLINSPKMAKARRARSCFVGKATPVALRNSGTLGRASLEHTWQLFNRCGHDTPLSRCKPRRQDATLSEYCSMRGRRHGPDADDAITYSQCAAATAPAVPRNAGELAAHRAVVSRRRRRGARVAAATRHGGGRAFRAPADPAAESEMQGKIKLSRRVSRSMAWRTRLIG